MAVLGKPNAAECVHIGIRIEFAKPLGPADFGFHSDFCSHFGDFGLLMKALFGLAQHEQAGPGKGEPEHIRQLFEQ